MDVGNSGLRDGFDLVLVSQGKKDPSDATRVDEQFRRIVVGDVGVGAGDLFTDGHHKV